MARCYDRRVSDDPATAPDGGARPGAARPGGTRAGRVFRRSLDPELPIAVEAHGSTIVDAAGREYLDASGGAIVVNVGHGRRSIGEAIGGQTGRLAYAHGSAFTTEPIEEYAREVGKVLPIDGPAIYPVSGGSEAIETALKLARSYHLARGAGGSLDRDLALGQLSRQHARRARPVRSPAAAPPVRGLARAVPPCLGRLPLPGGRARQPCPRRRR